MLTLTASNKLCTRGSSLCSKKRKEKKRCRIFGKKVNIGRLYKCIPIENIIRHLVKLLTYVFNMFAIMSINKNK